MISQEGSHFSIGATDPEHYRAGQRVTLVSVGVNLVLAIAQIIVGYFGKSQALMTDGLHTLSDLLSDFLVLFANRHSAEAADAEHPYGHKRIETAATLFLGIALFGVGISILWNAGIRLTSGQPFQTVHVATLWVAALTLVCKETLYHYMIRVARRLRSQMLAANAWHTRSDAAVSLVGATGIAGNLMGFAFLDSLAAALVAFMIARMGWRLGYQALAELVDTALDAEEVAAIRTTLTETPGVRGLHELRTRKMAGQALVDAHVLVEPRISVSEGHYIAESARSRVLKNHDVLDVMVHVDPEDDSVARPSAHLPGREALIGHLEKTLGCPLPEGSEMVLHYLGGKVEGDLFLDPSAQDSPQLADLERHLASGLAGDKFFRQVRLHRREAL